MIGERNFTNKMLRSWVVTALPCLLALVLLPLVAGVRIAVPRGRRVDFRPGIPSLSFHGGGPCTVRLATPAAAACGVVTPSAFNCSYNGSLLYHHLGCFAPREILSFQVSSTADDDERETNVAFFSVEIIVENSASSPLSGIGMQSIWDHRQVGVASVRVLFPSQLVGRCHYELLSQHPLLPLPLAGRLVGEVNRPLPCGVVPRMGVVYVSLTQRETDYVLLRVRTRTGSPVYVVAALQLSESLPRSVQELRPANLVVPQAADTPVNSTLLLQDFAPIADEEYRFMLPILPGGSFLPVHGSTNGASSSTFTLSDLRAGVVSFQPSEMGSPFSANYPYSVVDMTGTVVARGTVRVHVPHRDWSLPSQRTNRGLAVTQGSSVQLDTSKLDFYSLGQCWLRLLSPPLHGHFRFFEGRAVGEKLLDRDTFHNGSILYSHSGDDSMSDGSSWEVLCASSSLVVFVSIRIAPVGDFINDMPAFLAASTITASSHFGTPLSVIALAASPMTTTQIASEHGSFVQIQNHSWFDLPFYPLVHLSVFHSHGKHVSSISLAYLQEELIWYIPPHNYTTDSLSFDPCGTNTVQPCVVNVTVSNQSLGSSHCVSTLEETYPSLLHSVPLPMHDSLPVYITPAFLSAHLGPFTPSSVLYEVVRPPSFGYVCHIQHSCNSSLMWFTQQDISLQQIVYVPMASEHLRNDTLQFFLSIEGVRGCSSHLRHLEITVHPKNLAPSPIKQFWINRGGLKKISAKYFRHYVRWFSSKNLTFHITSPPQHGVVMLRSSTKDLPCSEFTYTDALEHRLWFQHNLTSGPHCSDTIGFTVMDRKTLLQSSLRVIVKQSTNTKVSVQATPRRLEGASSFIFSGRDLKVSGAFCPEFIVFTIDNRPQFGVLSLYLQESGSVVQLAENSTFSAQDVLLGRLQYTLTQQRQNTSDKFRFSVEYPQGRLEVLPPRNHPQNEGPDVYEVIITTPEPGVVHNISISIDSPRPLTWLPRPHVYGYILTSADIVVQSDTTELHPSKVSVDIVQPAYGSITLNGTRTSYFSLMSVHQGWVRYESPPKVRRFGHSDSFNVSIIVFLRDRSVHVVHSKPFTIVWSTVQLTRHSYDVGEADRSALVTLRWG